MLWNLLVNAMSSSGDPVFIDDCAAAAMRAGKAEKWCAPYRNLPRPSAERCILAANNTRFWSTNHRYAAIWFSFNSQRMNKEKEPLYKIHTDTHLIFSMRSTFFFPTYQQFWPPTMCNALCRWVHRRRYHWSRLAMLNHWLSFQLNRHFDYYCDLHQLNAAQCWTVNSLELWSKTSSMLLSRLR